MSERDIDGGGGAKLSYAHGPPLAAEAGVGALTLGGYLREVTSRFGPREAAVLRTGDEVVRWTYAELWERAMDVARALVACGVGKGTRVGVLMTNRPEFLAAVFGTALAGGVATNISTFFTSDELDEVLRASGCAVLLFERAVLKRNFAVMLAELEPQVASTEPGRLASLRYPYLRHLAAVGEAPAGGAVEAWPDFLARGGRVAPELVEARAAAVAPSDPGTLFFSSGSTGKSKGILHAQRSVCLQLWRWKQWYGIDEPPRTWSSNGFFFSGNFSSALGGTLSSGGALVLQRYFEAESALALMEQERATMLQAWPHQMAQLEAAPNYAATDLSAMRYLDAGSPIARHPSIATDWREPAQAYGCTETFTLISVYASGTPAELAQGSHGVPTAGSSIKIVDPLTGETAPLGARGEIAVKGPTLMLGYLGVPLDETVDAEGYYRTGDGGWLDADGRLFWEGRLSDIIKTGGANVSPQEVDQVLRALPGVKIAQTVGVPDPLLGELVVACVVPQEGVTLDEAQVVAGARAKLASYKAPRRVLFFTEDELKTTGSAKIKTADLRKLAAERLAATREPS